MPEIPFPMITILDSDVCFFVWTMKLNKSYKIWIKSYGHQWLNILARFNMVISA